MIYLVDSNCFMAAAQVNYPFDIAESFWKKIAEEAQKHKFNSIDKVQNEIKINDDQLSNWCKSELPEDFFISTETAEVYEQYGKLVNWAQSKGINQRGVDKFINVEKADIFFVAFASLHPELYTIVTEEKSAIYSKSDIKLPDACTQFNIRCINFIEMLRELHIKF